MKLLVTSAAAVALTTGAACAAPALMTEGQMDQIVAGIMYNYIYSNPGGQVVWFYDRNKCHCEFNPSASDQANSFTPNDPGLLSADGQFLGVLDHWTVDYATP